MLQDAPRSKTDPHVAALAERLSIQKDPLKFLMTLGTDREHQTAAEIVRRHGEILIDPHELQQFRGADDGGGCNRFWKRCSFTVSEPVRTRKKQKML